MEISQDNRTCLQLCADDLNMHRVLQQSTCKHGVRRKVAKRVLNSLGTVSGLCTVLNDREHIEELKAGLQFAQSFEEIRAAEKQRKKKKALAKKKKEEDRKKLRAAKQLAAREKLKKIHAVVLEKLGLGPEQPVLQRHLQKLSIPQLKVSDVCVTGCVLHMFPHSTCVYTCQAVAFFQCDGKKLTGKADEMRADLKTLLPVGAARNLQFPDYVTQEECYDSEGVSDEDCDSSDKVEVSLSFDELRVGECVEVYWEGEGKWFEGEVTGLDTEGKQYKVFYREDSQEWWHDPSNYPMRLSC